MKNAGGGTLPANIVHFVRLLRAAGMPVGPDRMLRAVEAVQAVGPGSRQDFYWALHAVLVGRREQHELFTQAFRLFWRDPKAMERMMGLLLPGVRADAAPEERQMPRRLSEALARPGASPATPPGQERVELDAALSWSDRERLMARDFEQMSAEELARAKAEMKRLPFASAKIATRRFKPLPRGTRIDLRATLRESLRRGGEIRDLARRRRRTRPPPLVALCDISGSMGRYSRMLLHFLHAVTNDRDRVHCFLFGTRLTNITRELRARDVDEALARVARVVPDWSGGTRIGTALRDFNRLWSRRVLGQGAVVLLITDGLDRDGGAGLSAAMDRLHRSCRRLVWLNPLLRWEGFAPKSSGARAMLPHVDEFRPTHSLDSLADLARALADAPIRRHAALARWRNPKDRGE